MRKWSATSPRRSRLRLAALACLSSMWAAVVPLDLMAQAIEEAQCAPVAAEEALAEEQAAMTEAEAAAVAAVPDSVVFDLFMLSLTKHSTNGRRAFLRQAGLAEDELAAGVAFVDQYADQRVRFYRREGGARLRREHLAETFASLGKLVSPAIAAKLQAHAAGQARLGIRVQTDSDEPPVLPPGLPPKAAPLRVPEMPLEGGATCEEMGDGWYYSGDLLDCDANCDEPCVKQQTCNGGACQPWPNYCWQCQGGGPPIGRTCDEMGWYDAQEYDDCVRDCNGVCMHKQWCDTGYCQPWPNYCWKCSDEPPPPPPDELTTYSSIAYDDAAFYLASSVTSTDPGQEVKGEIQVFNDETGQEVTSESGEGAGDASAAATMLIEGGTSNVANFGIGGWFKKKWNAIFNFLKKKTLWQIFKVIQESFAHGKNAVTCYGNPTQNGTQCSYTTSCTGTVNCDGTYTIPFVAGSCPAAVKKTYDWNANKLIGDLYLFKRCSNPRYEELATASCSCSPGTPSVSMRTDVTGDYSNDLAWANDISREVRLWHMAGPALYRQDTANPAAPVDTNWRLANVADFNADARPDLVWRNTTSGRLAIWFMDGATRTTALLVEPIHDTTWALVGVGRFDSDASPDLLWRNPAGDLFVTLMTGGAVLQELAVSPGKPAAANWAIQGTGDFDGDGKDDLVWRNTTSGVLSIWFMNGVTRSSGSTVAVSQPDPAWQVVALADMNANGQADIVWQNQTSGQLVTWFMNGATRVASVPLSPSTGESGWTIVGPR
jgi:VCBS repeat protein